MLRAALALISLVLLGCFPYVYHSQDRVLLPRVDLAATLEIARIELDEGGFDATLTVWAIRDQVVTIGNARTISALYFTYIDRIAAEKPRTTADFGVWHFAWAIANLYRNGNVGVRKELRSAYVDATSRPATLKRFGDAAREHVNGPKIYMGDFHGYARSYARTHVVVPGDSRYVQSLDDYLKAKAEAAANAATRGSRQKTDL